MYIKFVRKVTTQQPVINEVSPQGESQIIIDQNKDQDIQKMIRIIRDGETPPSHINFESQFFQKINKNKTRLEVINKVLYRNYYNHTGQAILKQIVVPNGTIDDIIRTLHENPLQGHPGSSKMLHELRKRYYHPNLALKYKRSLTIANRVSKHDHVQTRRYVHPLRRYTTHVMVLKTSWRSTS